MLHELEDRLDTSLPLSQRCLGMVLRTRSRCSFSQLLQQGCEHLSVCAVAVSRNSSRHPADAAVAAAAHAGHFWEQYVRQASVPRTARKKSFHLVVISHVQYSQVAPCCLWWLHAISFAQTLCLVPVPSLDGSSELHLESASNLFCSELFWVSWDHQNILLLRYPMGPMVWRTLYVRVHDLVIRRWVLHPTWTSDWTNNLARRHSNLLQ